MKKTAISLGLGLIMASTLAGAASTTNKGSNPKGKPFVELNGQIVEIQGAVTDISTKLDLLVNEVDNMEDRVAANEAAIATLQSQNTSLQAQIDANGDSVAAVLQEIDALKLANDGISQQLLGLGGQDAYLEGEIQANRAQILSLQSSLEPAVLSIMAQIADLKAAQNTLQTDMLNAESDISSLDVQVAGNSAVIAVSQSEISALESQVSNLLTQIGGMESDIADLQAQIDELGDADGALQGQIDANEARIATLQTDVSSNQAAIADHETKMGTLEADQADLLGQMTGAEFDIQDLQAQIHTNDSDISALQTSLDNTRSDLQGQINDNLAMIESLQTDIALANEAIATKQNMVNGVCPSGQAATAILEDGSLVCGAVGGGSVGSLHTYYTFNYVIINAGGAGNVTAYCNYNDGYRATGGGQHHYASTSIDYMEVYTSVPRNGFIDGSSQTIGWSVSAVSKGTLGRLYVYAVCSKVVE